jgi:hypothetical protein
MICKIALVQSTISIAFVINSELKFCVFVFFGAFLTKRIRNIDLDKIPEEILNLKF